VKWAAQDRWRAVFECCRSSGSDGEAEVGCRGRTGRARLRVEGERLAEVAEMDAGAEAKGMTRDGLCAERACERSARSRPCDSVRGLEAEGWRVGHGRAATEPRWCAVASLNRRQWRWTDWVDWRQCGLEEKGDGADGGDLRVIRSLGLSQCMWFARSWLAERPWLVGQWR
jgi:hypothetical protein